MAVCGKTTPPQLPLHPYPPPPPHPAAGFQFHAMRKRQPRVQSSREEKYENVSWQETVSLRRDDARHVNVVLTLYGTLLIFPSFGAYHSRVEILKEAFIFVLHV